MAHLRPARLVVVLSLGECLARPHRFSSGGVSIACGTLLVPWLSHLERRRRSPGSRGGVRLLLAALLAHLIARRPALLDLLSRTLPRMSAPFARCGS